MPLPKLAHTSGEKPYLVSLFCNAPAKVMLPAIAAHDFFAGKKPWEAQFLSRAHLRELFEAFTMPRALSNSLYKMVGMMHDIFEAHSLHYVADGGSMLGALRHGGLVPWDDDADVVIKKEQEPLFLSTVKNALHQQGYKIVGGGIMYKIVVIDPSNPKGYDCSKGFIDVFVGEKQAKGWWGYPWFDWPFWIKKDELHDTHVVPFGPVKIRQLVNAPVAVCRMYGEDCLTNLKLTHVHHKRTTRLAQKTRLPVYFPDDEPSYRQPAGWDAELFPETGATH